jgi:hypothetical protein
MKTRISPILITFTLICFALPPAAHAVVPAPDGGYPNFTTAEGTKALQSLTTGSADTGVGWYSLFSNAAGSFNTAVGAGALDLNTADSNTATGAAALLFNTTGTENTANGTAALEFNDTGFHNTATGAFALSNNTTGEANTAIGHGALFNNTIGIENTAIGDGALADTTGALNTALGKGAGGSLTTGDENIDIGNPGVAGESDTIRIGQIGFQGQTFIAGISLAAVTGTAVVVNDFGQLGVAPSSERFKQEIKSMDKTSESILALRPVTFYYKKEIEPKIVPQFGLVAEEVEKVNPDLVVRDKEGKPYTVRYDAVNAMLLNEFLKEHKKTEKLEATVASLIATVKEQAEQIQKMSAQLEASKPAPQVVNNP